MKFSDAMERGIEVTKPLDGELWDYEGLTVCACALGAAAIGYHLHRNETLDTAYDVAKYLDASPDGLALAYKAMNVSDEFPNPVLGGKGRLSNSVISLNDEGVMTRKQIVQWLRENGK